MWTAGHLYSFSTMTGYFYEVSPSLSLRRVSLLALVEGLVLLCRWLSLFEVGSSAQDRDIVQIV